MPKKTVFVTVGTTLFEDLIDGVLSDTALDWMIANTYTNLVLQYGKGRFPTFNYADRDELDITLYDFRPSLERDMDSADLIICHAGAGTLMEALTKGKTVLTVINTKLMNNHQTELAYALGKSNHLLVVEEPSQLYLASTWERLESFVPVPFEPSDEHDIPRLLDTFLGVAKSTKKDE